MGLAGEKRKQRLVGSAVTRNSSWLADTSLPGQRLLSQMGWSEGQGIGGSGQGRTETIKTMYKMDNKGIGSQRAEKEMRDSGKAGVGGADKWIGGGGELGGLFERLNAASTSSSGVSTPIVEEMAETETITSKDSKKDKKRKRKAQEPSSDSSSSESEEEPKPRKSKGKSKEDSKKKSKKADGDDVKKSKKERKSKKGSAEKAAAEEAVAVEKAVQTIRNASRAKFLRAKRQLHGDAVSMNEILGIASGSNSPAPALTPAVEAQSDSPLPAAVAPEEVLPLAAALIEGESDKERRKREKREKKEKKERKASKAQAKEAKQAGATSSTEDSAAPKVEPVEKKELVMNTVSPLSVHEYLSRKLMLRKAQMARKRKTDQEAVWGRLSAGSGVGIMVE
ncbi:hypothetical protein BCV69DRAFT_283833 [Microstroma glucosiphilum]|uniref:G-patch domain-containing protein n=1 Tax=Pseudomicrostroma glucosiphilum TaxID=1684307 RepID=A0A316U327_9BASI|nr:hypothetical protein BCV69DRAFT_283833 [Pseudomicrostroma glucosiphilum]PWN19726.1 hypothetical protein BCV69DRAFT_283833 [Pseudomicrostroma glucosiphilum]